MLARAFPSARIAACNFTRTQQAYNHHLTRMNRIISFASHARNRTSIDIFGSLVDHLQEYNGHCRVL